MLSIVHLSSSPSTSSTSHLSFIHPLQPTTPSRTHTQKKKKPCRTYRCKRYVEVKGGHSGVAMGTVSTSTPTNQLTKNRTTGGKNLQTSQPLRPVSAPPSHRRGAESRGALLRFEVNECVKKVEFERAASAFLRIHLERLMAFGEASHVCSQTSAAAQEKNPQTA